MDPKLLTAVLSLLGIVNTSTIVIIMYIWKNKVSKDECDAWHRQMEGMHLDLREMRQWIWELLSATNGNKNKQPPPPPSGRICRDKDR